MSSRCVSSVSICHRSDYQLRPTVLNPAVRFSWIEKEWESAYIRDSKRSILKLVSTSINSSCHVSQTYPAQMRRYRPQGSAMPVVEVPNSPVPCPGGRAPPTRFKVKRPTYERNSSAQEVTVEAEYQKYVSGGLSSSKTDILKFWEVRHILLELGRRNDSLPNRPIRPSSLHYFQLPWTTSRYKPRPFLVNGSSRQQRRQTPRNATG